MKNPKTYIKNHIERATDFTPDLVKESTARVMLNIQRNIELGNIKYLDEKSVDYIMFRVIETYYE